MSEHGTYETIDGRPALRFERRLPHPAGLVWRALTEPGELAHWFPALVERELEPGGKMTFTFADGGLPPSDGHVHEVEPPRLFAFSWGEEELRFELEELADGRECLLRFTHLLEQRDQAANNAAGWHVCLDRLAAHLRGEAVEAPGTEMTDELRGLAGRLRGPRRAEQLGVDALGDPAIAVARHHHATFPVAADGHEVGAVLVGAGTVVHEHQVKVVVGPARGAPGPPPPAPRSPWRRGASRDRSRAPARARCRRPARAPRRPPPRAWSRARAPSRPPMKNRITSTPRTMPMMPSVERAMNMAAQSRERKGPPREGGPEAKSAATYSPSPFRVKYHRR